MLKRLLFLSFASVFIYSCSTSETAVNQKPTSPDTTTAQQKIDFSSLLEPPKGWHHLDKQHNQFPGISSKQAYTSILESKTPEKEIVVAVIDGGVDATHEDLHNVMWVNEDEIPGNNKDDDQNGYIDDIHGWNFIGGADGENINHDTFELTRIYRRLHKKFANSDTTNLSKSGLERYHYFQEIKSDYEKEINTLHKQYANIESLRQSMDQAKNVLDSHFSDSAYTYEDIQNLQPSSRELNFAKNVMSYVMENDIDSTLIADQKKQIYEFAKYGYNPDFNPRHIVGDDYSDKTEQHYGNPDVAGPDPSHGTHVAGIIAAERNNGIGVNGVAENTRIMAVRAVPNGDERDKDVANAIRYAVDNGADIINMSFGKGYSPYKKVVDRAVKYADDHGVLMVHGAGNEAKNIDKANNFPTDTYSKAISDSAATLWISVGATSWKPNKNLVANFSNYGNQTVDIFAPGVDIYSTMPDNKYQFQDGTSMASPVVAGAAALIMAHYPSLSTKQVRNLLLEHSARYPNQTVHLPNQDNPNTSSMILFPKLSVSNGIINVYNALRGAENLSNQ